MEVIRAKLDAKEICCMLLFPGFKNMRGLNKGLSKFRLL